MNLNELKYDYKSNELKMNLNELKYIQVKTVCFIYYIQVKTVACFL